MLGAQALPPVAFQGAGAGAHGAQRGAGHQWPGAIPNRLAEILLHTDPPSTALNATHVIWQFFAAHIR